MVYAMTTETLITKVREKLGTLDKNGEQILSTVLDVFKEVEALPLLPKTSKESFVSQNITLREYKILSPAKKERYLREAEKLNQDWIENQFRKLKANWIMVVDGQIVLFGAKLKDYPEHNDFLALCRRTGKYPFVFINQRALAVEEHATAWHETYEPGDAYPALSVTVSGNNKYFDTEADLDTGAADCYGALELLTAKGIIKTQPDEARLTSQHLNKQYVYFIKHLWLELVDTTGTKQQCRAMVVCVSNWLNSPFTSINPARTFLLGRSVLLELRPRLILDFANRCTEVQFAKAGS